MFRNAYNYKRQSRLSVAYVQFAPVVEIDTSVTEAVKNSNSMSANESKKGVTYLDNETPTNYYGASILMTEFDPIARNWQKAHSAQSATQTQQAAAAPAAAAAAAAVNAENVSNNLNS